MSQTRFISDLHFGHKRICEFEGPNRGNSKTVEEHDAWLIKQFNSVVHKKDKTWILGDVAFTEEGLKKIAQLNGRKQLILGNHDNFHVRDYLSVFTDIYGLVKYKGIWLSHAPIHESELRGCLNIHGHLHSRTIPDNRYICVSVENLNGMPKTMEQLK